MANRALCIMHYAFFLYFPLSDIRSVQYLMHFEIYATRYYVIKTFRLYNRSPWVAPTVSITVAIPDATPVEN